MDIKAQTEIDALTKSNEKANKLTEALKRGNKELINIMV